MGTCASTGRQRQEEDESIQRAPSQRVRAQQPLPHAAAGAPPHQAAFAALALSGGNGISGGSTQPGGGGGKLKLPPSDQHLFFRQSQEEAMAHLTRHPRLQPFQQKGGRFGLAPAYETLKLLGRGGTGQTWLCRETATGRLYGVKLQQRPIPHNTVKLAYNEITIQASTCVSSVHSTHIKEALLTPTHLALVLDFEAGGSAAEFVAKQIPRVGRDDLIVDEDFARFAFKQLVLGLEHLHQNHVAHRDVKLDNTLLDGEQLPTFKLCDFQFAKYWGRPQLSRTKTHLGTAVYMSPELIENRRTHDSYDPVKVDVWAAGIWLAALLLGAFVYDNRPGVDDMAAELQILQQERGGPWHDSKFVRPYVHLLSPELKDLLNQALHSDPHRRISLEGIAAHPWMHKPLPPHLEKAWQRVRRAQMQLEHRLSALEPDQDLVQQRSSRVYDMVHEAAMPTDRWEESYQRLAQRCRGSPMVDCSTEGVVRIDMQPESVAGRLLERALALLDASPPGTPKRHSAPMQHVASDGSLCTLATTQHVASSTSLSAPAGGEGVRPRSRASDGSASGHHPLCVPPSPFASAAGAP